MAKAAKDITPEEIIKRAKNNDFSNVYFLHGEEPYYIDVISDYFENEFMNEMEKAFNQTIVYGKDLTARQILETCGRLPTMAERQLVIIKEAQALSLKQEDEEQYLRYLKNPVKSTVLVFAWKHGTPDGRKSFGNDITRFHQL